jgi:nicotinamidase-related amidase
MPATALDPKTALVVIDFQPGLSSYPTVHPFRDVVANAARLALAFRAAKLPVVLVTVALSPDGGDAPGGRTDAPRRAIPTGPEFSKLVPELEAQPRDILVTKRQPNAFYGTELDLQLRRRHVTGIVLAGVATSSGVDSTARAAHERSYNLTFASDAIADVDGESHDFVMRKIFPRLGEVDSTDARPRARPQVTDLCSLRRWPSPKAPSGAAATPKYARGWTTCSPTRTTGSRRSPRSLASCTRPSIPSTGRVSTASRGRISW